MLSPRYSRSLVLGTLYLCSLGLCLLSVERLVEAQCNGTCCYPPVEPRTDGASWPRGATVTVYIDSDDFQSAEEQEAIKKAFTNWQNSNSRTNANVTFNFVVTANPPFPQQANQYTVGRGASSGGGISSIGTSGGVVTNAFTYIDPVLTDLNMITDTMAHEIGHTFGLGDCYYPDCQAGGSIMGPRTCDGYFDYSTCVTSGKLGTFGVYPGLQGPTSCDAETVRKVNYVYLAEYEYCSYQPCDRGYQWSTYECTCVPKTTTQEGWSPVVIDVSGDGFDLTDAENGVDFDLNGDGVKERLSWTAVNSDDAWLVLDRNGDGRIGSGQELFGDFTPQPPSPAPNGFNALAEFDRPARGGNSDGVIDGSDAVFASLRLWQDADHDGISQPAELHTLDSLRVTSISLDYREVRRRDAYGNLFRYQAPVTGTDGRTTRRLAYDVFLVAGR